jgi:hypothetical protein
MGGEFIPPVTRTPEPQARQGTRTCRVFGYDIHRDGGSHDLTVDEGVLTVEDTVGQWLDDLAVRRIPSAHVFAAE